MKETEKDSLQIDIPCSYIRRINIVKIAILPKAVWEVSAIPTKILKVFFADLHEFTNNSKNYIETQKTLSSESNLGERRTNWSNHTGWFKTIVHNIVIKNSMV